jgi:predicted transcriptional regulator
MCYTARMAAKVLTDAMKLVETWPEAAQEELAWIALEIDAVLNDGAYHATQDELAGIDRGIRAADERRFVEPGDVAAVFAKHRPA